MQLSDFKHQSRIQIRWGDVDMLGHVNNAKYFTYLESARTDYLAQLLPNDDGELWKSRGVILADIQCSFGKPLFYPGDVIVGTHVVEFGNKSCQLECGLFPDGSEEAIATSKAVLVWMDFKAGKPAPWPDDVKRVIQAFEGMATV